jgi:DNA mismatch endonuclease (patch repair protein)
LERLLKSRLRNGQFDASPERSRAMAAVRSKGNKTTEVRLRMAMVRAGIAGWSSQQAGLPGKPDFFFPSAKLAVFVDGCFWHGCTKCGHIPKKNTSFWSAKIERNRNRHRKVGRLLNRHGIGAIRFWEHQLRDNLAHCVSRIENRLATQSATAK